MYGILFMCMTMHSKIFVYIINRSHFKVLLSTGLNINFWHFFTLPKLNPCWYMCKQWRNDASIQDLETKENIRNVQVAA